MRRIADDFAEPRVRSGVWVDAYIRRVGANGGFAALSRRGDASAGAIFVEVIHKHGTDLYAPAPLGSGRVFEPVLKTVTGHEVAERLEREARFDRDLWVVSVEDVEGRHFLMAHEHV